MNTHHGSRLQRRGLYWIREAGPTLPFLWGGLLPLLGLLLLLAYAWGPFAHQAIQDEVARHTREVLEAQGKRWVNVTVSGQQVRLAGSEPSAGDGERAIALARGAYCPTWLGRLVCPIEVRGQFETAAAPPPAALPPAAIAPPVAVAAAQVAACEKSLADIVRGSRIEFATDSAELHPSSAGILDALAAAARECPGTIRVEGYTDSVGKPEANRILSESRANAVRRALIERGIPEARLQATGFGADKPLGDNSTAAGREANRRIEFHVIGAP